jgi:tetratricopeptide (TPR) repeat protein
LGNYLWSGGLVEAAIAEFHFAIQAAPDRAFPLWALGNVYEDRKDFDLARRTYERALEVEPDSVVGNMNLGRLLKKKGDRVLAREYLNRAIFLDPSYVPARTLLKEIG